MHTLLSPRSLHDKLKEFYQFFPEHVEQGIRQSAERLIHEALSEEIDILVSAGRYERNESRRAYRNGHYERHLASQYGLLRVKVPRIRGGKVTFQTLARYRRYSGEIAEAVRGLFIAGVSTRKLGPTLERLLGMRISPQTVSRIASELDNEVRIFHSRALGDDYQYLFLDGIVQSIQVVGGTIKGPILVAYGIRHDGSREIIGFMKVARESKAAWESFLEDLFRRGLTGERLKLIVADGCPGLWSALESVYPRVKRQLCWAHKMRNIRDKLPKKAHDTCLQEAKRIYLAPSRKKATEIYFQWTKKWRRRYPRAVRCLSTDIDRLLVHFSFPIRQRTTLRTTNPIERLFVEVRRRTKIIGSFTNSESVNRITYGVFWIINCHWQGKRLRQFTQNY
jgi:transposase-like protein